MPSPLSPVTSRVKIALTLLGLGPLACGPAALPDPAVDADPFARLTDRTGIGAWEFGTCTRASDCAPAGCLDAVCGPVGDDALCDVGSRIGACLQQLDASLCHCQEGLCRWYRDVEVLQCAVAGAPRPGSMPVVGTDEREWYPIRVTDR